MLFSAGLIRSLVLIHLHREVLTLHPHVPFHQLVNTTMKVSAPDVKTWWKTVFVMFKYLTFFINILC